MLDRKETINLFYDDLRHENGLSGIIVITRKEDNVEVGYFRYIMESNGTSLKTKVAKVIPIDTLYFMDEQVKYELTYFAKEIFPKTFLSKVDMHVNNDIRYKLKGYATMVDTDEDGKPILDEKGNPKTKKVAFDA